MAITKLKPIQEVYKCSIETVKHKVCKPIPPVGNHYDNYRYSTSEILYEEREIVQIKMPAEEYERFSRDWEHSLTIVLAAKNNPQFRDEYNKLVMYATLLL